MNYTFALKTNQKETEEARLAGSFLTEFLSANPNSGLALSALNKTLHLPPSAIQIMANLLDAMSKGQSVSVVTEEEEISTAQAAEILNVSRPFVVKLIENGELPSRKVGTHRRVFAKDVLEFKAKSFAKSASILDELVADAQEDNMGYGD